jgi:hypothetical protein
MQCTAANTISPPTGCSPPPWPCQWPLPPQRKYHESQGHGTTVIIQQAIESPPVPSNTHSAIQTGTTHRRVYQTTGTSRTPGEASRTPGGERPTGQLWAASRTPGEASRTPGEERPTGMANRQVAHRRPRRSRRLGATGTGPPLAPTRHLKVPQQQTLKQWLKGQPHRGRQLTQWLEGSHIAADTSNGGSKAATSRQTTHTVAQRQPHRSRHFKQWLKGSHIAASNHHSGSKAATSQQDTSNSGSKAATSRQATITVA